MTIHTHPKLTEEQTRELEKRTNRVVHNGKLLPQLTLVRQVPTLSRAIWTPTEPTPPTAA